MHYKDFVKIFGLEGQSSRFEGCEAKNGDKATGEYLSENKEVYFVYLDSKGRQYQSTEMPQRKVILNIIKH